MTEPRSGLGTGGFDVRCLGMAYGSSRKRTTAAVDAAGATLLAGWSGMSAEANGWPMT